MPTDRSETTMQTVQCQTPDYALYDSRTLYLIYDEACGVSADMYAKGYDTTEIEARLDKVEAEMVKRELL